MTLSCERLRQYCADALTRCGVREDDARNTAAVLVSADGQNFTEVAPAAQYQFDAATGNRIRIDFDAVDATFVQVVFTMNSSSRTGGAQAAEIEVY